MRFYLPLQVWTGFYDAVLSLSYWGLRSEVFLPKHKQSRLNRWLIDELILRPHCSNSVLMIFFINIFSLLWWISTAWKVNRHKMMLEADIRRYVLLYKYLQWWVLQGWYQSSSSRCTRTECSLWLADNKQRLPSAEQNVHPYLYKWAERCNWLIKKEN